ncbi:MAG: aminotransferase class V-fold PLP-dependent enzyme [Firmicutes bacterium]|nr:aminotransferase class V-fold PLP-dependent enzyme [Bacillota bacterium]
MFFQKKYNINNIRKHVIGIDTKIPLKSGKKTTYINFDNAASTPTLLPILNKVTSFLEWYSSIHRGTGYKSKISTSVYDKAHEIVSDFVNSSHDKNTVIFVKNTTEAINKLSYRLNLSHDDIVITSLMEHHSNDLPWRNHAKTIHIKVLKDSSLDLNDLEYKLKKYKNNVKLVAITGCSNVTGIVNDIHHIASICHSYNTKLLVDGAQLIPHREINMSGYSDDDYIDFLVFSAHKMYAPFGTGVLIGPKSIFLKGNPEYVGGGTITSVTQHNSYWADLPDKEEAGTPNVVGAVALAEAIKIMNEIGMDEIKAHEYKLATYFMSKLNKFDDIEVYSNVLHEKNKDIVGVISFNVKGVPHGLIASALSYEGGIGVRNGCFCAHPYIHHLLNLSSGDISSLQKKLIFGDYSNVPGLVRVSFGMYNTRSEIDTFIEVLDNIMSSKTKLLNNYNLIEETGEYTPKLNYKNILKEFTL